MPLLLAPQARSPTEPLPTVTMPAGPVLTEPKIVAPPTLMAAPFPRLVTALALALRLAGSYLPLVLPFGSKESKLSNKAPPEKTMLPLALSPPGLEPCLMVVTRTVRLTNVGVDCEREPLTVPRIIPTAVSPPKGVPVPAGARTYPVEKITGPFGSPRGSIG